LAYDSNMLNSNVGSISTSNLTTPTCINRWVCIIQCQCHFFFFFIQKGPKPKEKLNRH
jgi:hypothetical protein